MRELISVFAFGFKGCVVFASALAGFFIGMILIALVFSGVVWVVMKICD